MVDFGNGTMDKVESMVCEQVNKVMDMQDRKCVSVSDLYVGKKNIPFARVLARNFVFDVLHNRYGYSYNVIAQRAEMDRLSVMRCVRKCHLFISCDKTYSLINEMINDKIIEWYGE